MKQEDQIRAAIIGTGNIGTDVLIKLERSELVRCSLFVGRNPKSKGIQTAKSLHVETATDGLDDLLCYADEYDVVFDATSAMAHKQHEAALKPLGKHIIDLTPARIGKMCVPAINMEELLNETEINMITCGGQAATPITHALGKIHNDIEYIEVVSSIASKSAGPATRANIDEYIDTTEMAIKKFSGCQQAKAILNINPAIPDVNMKTTILAKINNPDLNSVKDAIHKVVKLIQYYVPGYELLVEPSFNGQCVMTMIGVTGVGDYLPKFAGNLDIITCAALRAAEVIAQQKITEKS